MPDLDGVERVADTVVATGAHGVVCLGLAGEVDALTVPERMDGATRVARAVDGRVPVLIGGHRA